jgi:hypothetical protein
VILVKENIFYWKVFNKLVRVLKGSDRNGFNMGQYLVLKKEELSTPNYL